MNQYVIYNATYHILICRQCGYAIPQDWILRHFRQLHKAIPLTIRSEIIEHGKSQNLWQPRDVQAVWETNAHKSPVQGLTVSPGFECLYDGCIKLTRTEPSMKQHVRKIHGWFKKDGIMWKKQAMQTFFQAQNRKYVLIV